MRMPWEKKERPPVSSSSMMLNNFVAHAPNKGKAFVREGYCYNAVVYRCTNEIAKACASIELELYQGDNEIETHAALDLLNQPNPMQGYDQFINQAITDFIIHGEVFILRAGGNKPSELWILSPLSMSVTAGVGGMPSAYVYEIDGNRKVTYPVDQLTGDSDIFHYKSYNPLDHWRGMSPLMAAALPTDIHNAGLRWNYSLLKNGARPSGIVEFEGDPTDQVVNRLKQWFKQAIQGEKNAGELAVLTGGAKFNQTESTAKDMDYLNTMKEMTKYIASVLGVPLPLVDNDQSSYNNMEQAKEKFWTDTVIPLFASFLNALDRWMLAPYGQDMKFKIDMDDIAALEGVRGKRFDRAKSAVGAGLLSIDEGRDLIGYEPVGGNAENLLIPSSMVPLDMPESAPMEDALKALGYSDAEIKALNNAG